MCSIDATAISPSTANPNTTPFNHGLRPPRCGLAGFEKSAAATRGPTPIHTRGPSWTRTFVTPPIWPIGSGAAAIVL